MNSMIKKIASFLLFGTLFCNVYADDTQELQNIYNSFLPDFQKMTPEASALGQYGTYQTSGYTGVPNISVPLFSISSGNFSMPLELCYDASGIKVDQQATYVGLGWNLIMGGSISQIVCGKNDFYENLFDQYHLTNQSLREEILPSMLNNYPSYCLSVYTLVRYPSIPTSSGTCLPLEEDWKKDELLRDVSSGARVPDVFQASFCGHSVSFVIDQRKPKIIGNDATVYKIDLLNYEGPYPYNIEITDDYGLKYLFSAAPKTAMEENASYNLSEIRNAAGRILVEFNYSRTGQRLLNSYYETVGKNDEVSRKPIASQTIYDMFVRKNYPHTLAYVINEYYPTTITTDKETVTFTYGTREDIKDAQRIEQITVTSNNNRNAILHTVRFDYGYFSESSFETTLCNRYDYSGVYGYKRLKLTAVTVDGKKYAFKYNEGQALPSRLTMKQDFWGYFNDAMNTEGLCASPKYRFDDDGQVVGAEIVGQANRYANESTCKIGTLNRITYPTGGYTKFDYEINHFDDIVGKYYYPSANSNLEYIRKETCGSGYNGHGYNTTPNTKEFDVSNPVKVDVASSSPYLPSNTQYYKLLLSLVGKDSNGRVVFSRYFTKYNHEQDFSVSCELPEGHYVLTSEFASVSNGLIIGGSINVSFPPEYKKDSSIADASGKSIGGGLRVRTIENYDSNNTLLGYTRYKYQGGKLQIPTVKEEHIDMVYLYAERAANPSIYVIPQALSCSLFFITSNPTYYAVCSLGCPNVGYSQVTKEHYDRSGQLMSYDIEKYYNAEYDCVQDKVFRVNPDGKNGKLLESTTYSMDHVPMHKVSYSYSTFGAHPTSSDIVIFPWTRCGDMSPGNSAVNVYYKYSLFFKSPICVLPAVVTETSYDGGNVMKSLVTAYNYKESNFQPRSITKTENLANNTNETSLINYWYPGDSEVTGSNTGYLTDVHNISEQVKAVEYKNGNTTGGYRNVYRVLANGLPVVSKNYSITQSEHEVMELDVTDYDIYGNIREYVKKDGTPVTIIWSYSHQVPVMEILGVTYSDIFMRFSDVARLENGILASDIINTTESLYSALREQGIMVTAYEYSPWYTVTCVITPNGNKNRYSYDSYGRLEKISDINNRLQQKYSYNYGTK